MSEPNIPVTPAPKRRWSLWALAIVLLLSIGVGVYWHHDRAGDRDKSAAARSSATPRVPVEVVEVAKSDVPIYLNGLGAVQAFNSVVVRSRVDGEIVAIAFEEGQTVRAGDMLAQIDPRPYQAALDQALAKKQQDEATLSSSKRDLDRTSQLASREFASKQQLDQQTAGVGSQTAQLAIDQAAIDTARTQFDYTTIRAPISGRLGFRLVDKGNIVHASDTTGIVQIAQIEPISVVFTAPENQLPVITEAKRRGEVKLIALTSDNKAALGEGVLSLINNEVDPATGTIKLKAVFPNADGKLWPGLSVNTRLLVQTLQGVLTVPDAAVQRGQNEMFVYVVGPDEKAEKRVLTIGPYSDGVAVVEAGLRPGERIVVSGQSRIQPGILLEVAQGGGRKVADAAAANRDRQ